MAEADWTARSAVGKRMAALASTPFFSSGSSRLLFAAACQQSELTREYVKTKMGIEISLKVWRRAGSVNVDSQPSQTARRGNGCLGYRKVPRAILQNALYESSAPRSKLLRRGGKEVIQRALQSRKASVFRDGEAPLIGLASKSTLYANSKRDHREVVVTTAKVDVCDRCYHWDRVVSPKLRRLTQSWRDLFERLRAGQCIVYSHFGSFGVCQTFNFIPQAVF